MTLNSLNFGFSDSFLLLRELFVRSVLTLSSGESFINETQLRKSAKGQKLSKYYYWISCWLKPRTIVTRTTEEKILLYF